VAREFLCNSHMGRGHAYASLRRWPEAAADWQRCAALAPKEHRPWFEQQCALARVRSGAIDVAIAAADAQLDARPGAATKLFAARVHALAAGSDEARRQQHAENAMTLLESAVAEGAADASTLGDDADFAALRGLEEFQRLVAGR
jgi:tetratricopeptide (TPR) repeat protein